MNFRNYFMIRLIGLSQTFYSDPDLGLRCVPIAAIWGLLMVMGYTQQLALMDDVKPLESWKNIYIQGYWIIQYYIYIYIKILHTLES